METPSAAAAAAAATTADAAVTSGGTSSSHFQNSLRSLNKSSYKISKPSARNPNPNPNPNHIPNPPSNPNPNPIPNPPSNPNPNPQSQPPVYNIDKSDFREIVQKLTGSPIHRQAPPPPPPPAAAQLPPPPDAATAAISRLHRIRPPPLSNLPQPVGPTPSEVWSRPPFSPLPPLPTVSGSAESPITAYMRRLRAGPSPAGSAPPPPLSPLGFGCLGSNLPPTSPRMPLSSPR